MANFLIQTINGEIPFDFSFHLKEAIKYNDWFCGEKIHDYIYCEKVENLHLTNIENYIPIGSVEFVLNFYKKYHNVNILPINIPKELNKYEFLQRKIFLGNEKDNIQSLPDEKYFIKDISGFKKLTDIVYFKDIPKDNNILVSEKVNILSEWRCFVYKGELLDIRGYNTDIFVYPDVSKILEMINGYKNSPIAYTLDVAVIDNMKTALIEVHQFFSCGLYGFADYKVLANMFIETHKEILKSTIS